jgi:hypothetical protein
MAEQINNGGPAFPVPINPGETYQGHAPCDGMTLRDYFAAKAMAVVWTEIPDDADRDLALDRLGRYAYEMADAMLKAREGGAA